jgi:hypothetical protein
MGTRATGRRFSLDECSWPRGPVGDVDVIGTDFFAPENKSGLGVRP